MSLSIFNVAGAIEVLFDGQNQPWFKRAHVGKFLALSQIEKSLSGLERESKPRSVFEPTCSSTMGWSGPKSEQNKTDVFLSVYGVIYAVVKSRKSKGKELREWILKDIVPRGFNELLVKEHQKAIEEKQREIDERDMQIALLDDDLTESQEHARQIEYNNTGLQGEIRAKDQEIARRETELARVRERHVDRCRDPGKDNVIMIFRKHTTEEDDAHFEYPYYISRIQRRAIATKRRWVGEQFSSREEIVIIDNPNGIHAFNRLEEEGHLERYKCHFKLVDLTREDLYDMGVPAIEE